jgi:hypothetical protein
MEDFSFFITVFIFFLITSITLFSVNSGFGKNASKLLDPFEEHEK